MRKTLIPYLNVTLAAFRSDFAAYLDNRIRSLRSAKGEKNPDRETLRSIVEEINSRWNDLHEKITAEIKRKIDSTLRSLNMPSKDIPSHEKLKYAIRIKKISEVGIFSLTDSGSSGIPAKSLISNFIRDSKNISESIRTTVLRLKTELPDYERKFEVLQDGYVKLYHARGDDVSASMAELESSRDAFFSAMKFYVSEMAKTKGMIELEDKRVRDILQHGGIKLVEYDIHEIAFTNKRRKEVADEVHYLFSMREDLRSRIAWLIKRKMIFSRGNSIDKNNSSEKLHSSLDSFYISDNLKLLFDRMIALCDTSILYVKRLQDFNEGKGDRFKKIQERKDTELFDWSKVRVRKIKRKPDAPQK